MIRPPRSDFWQVGIVPAPITAFLQPELLDLGRVQVTWLPNPGPWRYLADPFGIRRGDTTHVFVEAFDYRTKHAVIEHHEYGPDLDWRGQSVALTRPFHLSYPYLVEDEGEVFMIPESHQANEIALYRAHQFPRQWVRETALLPDVPGAEASVIKHENLWWMFYTLVGPKSRGQRELHVAYANKLTGPWRRHPQNPIIDDFRGARPGGTPFSLADGSLVLPVQDCSQTYGGALRFLRLTALDPEQISFERLPPRLTGDLFDETYSEGCHTLSKCGELTLIDTKRIVRSWARHKINLQRHLAQLGLGPASQLQREA